MLQIVVFVLVLANQTKSYRFMLNGDEQTDSTEMSLVPEGLASCIARTLRREYDVARDIKIRNLPEEGSMTVRNSRLVNLVFMDIRPLGEEEYEKFWLRLCDEFPYDKANAEYKPPSAASAD